MVFRIWTSWVHNLAPLLTLWSQMSPFASSLSFCTCEMGASLAWVSITLCLVLRRHPAKARSLPAHTSFLTFQLPRLMSWFLTDYENTCSFKFFTIFFLRIWNPASKQMILKRPFSYCQQQNICPWLWGRRYKFKDFWGHVRVHEPRLLQSSWCLLVTLSFFLLCTINKICSMSLIPIKTMPEL